MEQDNQTKDRKECSEEECCAGKDVCSIDCSPKSKKKKSKCGCGGCCGWT